MISVNEIFTSLSGEGLTAGMPTTFVRISGCNFAEEGHPCSYCDTSYAWEKCQGREMTIAEIVQEVSRYPTREIILTGGEPLSIGSQKFDELIDALTGYHVRVETNGSIPFWNNTVSYDMDIKCPSSGNSFYNFYRMLSSLREHDSVKFVIGTREDFDFAKKVIGTYPTRATLLISPIWGKLNLQEVWEWVKEVPQFRLSLQLHKVIFGNKKGV